MAEVPSDIFEHEHPYPLIFVHKITNDILCETCARKLKPSEYDNYVWDNFFEGSPLDCDECNEIIESAYGNPEDVV